MSTSKKAAKSAIIIIVFTLGSKLLGFFREMLIAAKFGSGMETDTYFVAMSATALIINLMSNAINTTYIPVLSAIEAKEGREGRIKHTSNMINIVFLFSIILVLLGWFASPLLVKLLAKGFYGEQLSLAIKLTRIGLPNIIFSGIIGVLTGFLHSEQRHFSSAAIGFSSNFVFILFLVFLSTIFGIKGLMVASVIAVLSQLLTCLPEAKKSGYRHEFIFDIKDKYIKKVFYLSLPVFIGVAVDDLNAIVDRTLASSLAHGSISALNYAYILNQLIIGVFINAIITVIFPILSEKANYDNISGIKKTMGYVVNLILLITIPATVGLIVLANPIVETVFQRGEFDYTATIMTTQALIFYSVGLVAMALRLLITRVYYSLQDTKTPMINGIIYVGSNIIFNLTLIQFMAHAGLALATSIAAIIDVSLMFYDLRKKIGPLGTISYVKCGLKSGLASAIMGLIVFIMYNGMHRLLGAVKLSNLISLLSSVGIGVIVYGILCYTFGVEEIRVIVAEAKDRTIRKVRV